MLLKKTTLLNNYIYGVLFFNRQNYSVFGGNANIFVSGVCENGSMIPCFCIKKLRKCLNKCLLLAVGLLIFAWRYAKMVFECCRKMRRICIADEFGYLRDVVLTCFQ